MQVKTESELDAALAALPEFSRSVYKAIQAGLYAEPGFSDVVVEDIAIALKCKPVAANAAVGKLIEAGLVWTDHTHVNQTPHVFLYTYEHSEELRAKHPSPEATLEVAHMDGHHDTSAVDGCGLCMAVVGNARKDAIRASHVRAQKHRLTTQDEVAQATSENSFQSVDQTEHRSSTTNTERNMDGNAAAATTDTATEKKTKPKGGSKLPPDLSDGGKIYQMDPRKAVIPLHDKPVAMTDPLYDEKRLLSDDDLHLDELVESMDKSNADVFVHVAIRDNEAWVLIGGRSTRAARKVWDRREKAGKPTPNYIVVVRSGDADALATANLVSDYNRMEDPPMTQARKFQRLMESRGWTRKQIAFLTGQTEQTVKNTINLLKLNPELQNAVDTELGATVGYKLAELKPEKQSAVLTDLKSMAEARGGKIRKIDAEIAVQRAKGVADPEAAAIEAGAGDAEVPAPESGRPTRGKKPAKAAAKPKKTSSQDGNGPKYEPIPPPSIRKLMRAIDAGKKLSETVQGAICPKDKDLVSLLEVDPMTLLQVIAGVKHRAQAPGFGACLTWAGVKLST